MEYGWLCPRCGRVNAPFIAYCDCTQNDVKTDDVNCNHQWECISVSTLGSHYICKKCGKTKTVLYDPDHYGFRISG